jgi:hypothetical protein
MAWGPHSRPFFIKDDNLLMNSTQRHFRKAAQMDLDIGLFIKCTGFYATKGCLISMDECLPKYEVKQRIQAALLENMPPLPVFPVVSLV